MLPSLLQDQVKIVLVMTKIRYSWKQNAASITEADLYIVGYA